MSTNKIINGLPHHLNILTLKNRKTGVWIAQLLDYDVCTEADSFFELVFNVNDLIYAFFDIPKELQSKITYLPHKTIDQKEIQERNSSIEEKMKFNILLDPHLTGYKYT